MSSGCVWYFSELAVVVENKPPLDFLIFSYTSTNNSAVWIFNGWQIISIGFCAIVVQYYVLTTTHELCIFTKKITSKGENGQLFAKCETNFHLPLLQILL